MVLHTRTAARMQRSSRENMSIVSSREESDTICRKKLRRPLRRLLLMSADTDHNESRLAGVASEENNKLLDAPSLVRSATNSSFLPVQPHPPSSVSRNTCGASGEAGITPCRRRATFVCTGGITRLDSAKNARSHERYDYLYSIEELDPWIDRIKTVSPRAKDTYVVSNNYYLGKASVSALEISSILSRKPVKAPASLLQSYPELPGELLRKEPWTLIDVSVMRKAPEQDRSHQDQGRCSGSGYHGRCGQGLI
jgi:hypothetical protein